MGTQKPDIVPTVVVEPVASTVEALYRGAGNAQADKEIHQPIIGRRMIKPDTLAKVTGAAQYTADVCAHRKDLLYAKAKFPPIRTCLNKENQY